jgi:tyrosyl-tRNA synthetase
MPLKEDFIAVPIRLFRGKVFVMSGDEKKINELLTRNVEEVIEKDHLRRALLSGKKLRVKLGIDPTSPDLHLGHAVVLRKLREFQDLGHQIVLIIGDFTGRVGDPSGRGEARKPLAAAEVEKNMKDYLAQAGLILNIKKAKVVHNGDWFEKEGVDQMVRLASAGTFQQVLRRADFKKRIDAGQDITFLELLYPLFQGYDSVKVRADVEVGGTDQTFNLLMGRRVQRHFGMPEQDIMTFSLLEGLDGVRKMSKSYGNYVGLTDAPDDMFGKIMSVPDKLVGRYFMLCTDLGDAEVRALTKSLKPKMLKERLASEIVRMYHGEKEAAATQENFEKVFSKKEVPDELPVLKVRAADRVSASGVVTALDIVLASGVATSKSEARRLIKQGGFELDGKVIKNPQEPLKIKGGEVVRIGKKRFFRLSTPSA